MELAEVENNLVEELKTLCDENGKEIDPIKSVPIFHKLSKVYEKKNELEGFNCVRSVALLNAAIVREPQNEQIQSDLHRVCSAVLIKAKAEKQDGDLVNLSSKLKHSLKWFRTSFGRKFDLLEHIPYDAEGGQLLAHEKKRIAQVRNLQYKITRKYTELMRFISDECIKIMGKPPCKFSVAGMGSLARFEITPYSDFEHMILLENNFSRQDNQETVMRYFRWFSAIFLIVLINLRETILNCVAIPTLTPRYKDWFNDHFTPNGLTFDGMVAHASKIPLGRLPTTKKPWKTELIKPIDEMLKYLDADVAKIEGYHLSDMLPKVCFVSGDREVFDEYQERAHTIVKRNDKDSGFSGLLEQIDDDLQNLNIVNQQSNVMIGLKPFNMKRVIYRSATIFISAIGRLHLIKESSCFDIIDRLEENKNCNESVAHKLRLMVAMACEIRFKVYHSKGEQDDLSVEGCDYEEVVSGLIKLVGKQSLVAFMITASNIQRLLVAKLTDNTALDLKLLQDVSREFTTKLIMLFLLGFNEALKLEIAKLCYTIQPIDIGILGCLYAVNKSYDLDEYELCLKLCEQIISLCENDLELFEVKLSMLQCNVKLDRLDDQCVQIPIDELDKLMASAVDQPHYIRQRWNVLYEYAGCLQDLGRHVHANHVWDQCLNCYEEYVQTQLARAEEKYFDFLFDDKADILIRNADSLIEVEDFQKGHAFLHKALAIVKEANEPSSIWMYHDIYFGLGRCYLGMKNLFRSFICALEGARILNVLNDPLGSDHKEFIRLVFNITLAQCQFNHEVDYQLVYRVNDLQEMVLVGCEESTIQSQFVELDKLVDSVMKLPHAAPNRWVAISKYADCLQDLERNDQAHNVWEICLRCYEQYEKTQDDSDRDTNEKVKILTSYSQTLIEVKNYEKALELSHTALEILRPTNQSTGLHMCNYDILCYCYSHMKKYFKSFICSLESTRIAYVIDEPLNPEYKDDVRSIFKLLLGQY